MVRTTWPDRHSGTGARILATWLFLAASQAPAGQPADEWEREFSSQVLQEIPEVGIAGLAVALVDREETLFEAGYGLADIEAKRAVTPETIFHVASVSKMVTGTSLMMLWEEGAFRLDDDVSLYLNFRVRNPSFPDSPITFRHLSTHTSSISDSNYEEEHQRFFVAGDPDIPLDRFLQGYLAEDGRWFSREGSFLRHEPGTTWSYSNVGVALAGHLISRFTSTTSGRSLPNSLFSRLGIGKASWTLAGTDRSLLATPYSHEGPGFRRLEHIGYPDWPAGLLRISVREFAQFMKIYTNLGQVGGERFLEPDTVRKMLDIACYQTSRGEVRGQGLFWRRLTISGRSYIGHPGGDPGASALVVFGGTGERAAIIFGNTTHTAEVRPFLFRLADDLLNAPYRSEVARADQDATALLSGSTVE